MVRSTTGVASGPVSFMKLYDASTDAVKQGGTRRGANMGILRVDHPDIMEFITCKEDLTQVTNFNISVGDHEEVHGGGEERTRATTSSIRVDGKVVGQLDAHDGLGQDDPRRVAHRRAGRVLHRRSEPLQPGPAPRRLRGDESVRRAAAPAVRRLQPRLDQRRVLRAATGRWTGTRSERTSISATHFLDNIIDVNKYPLPEIDALSKRIRRIGLGVMGFADALVRLGIAYDTREGVEFGRKVMEFVDVEGEEGERAPRRGARSVPRVGAQSIWGPDETCARDENGKRIRPMQMLRNCNVTTVAPTGTISIIAGCSSGLEPLFAVAFMRNQAGVMMPDVNEDFVAIAKDEGWYSDELMERIAKTGTRRASPKCRRSGSACSSRRTRSRPSGTSGCRPPSRSTATRRSARRPTSRTRRRVEDVRAIYELAYEHEVQGRHRVPRRLARQPGAVDGRDGRSRGQARTGDAPASRATTRARARVGELQGTIAELRRGDRAR